MCEKRQDALHFSFWRDALPFDKQQQQQQDLGDWQLGLNWSALLPVAAPASAPAPVPAPVCMFDTRRRMTNADDAA